MLFFNYSLQCKRAKFCTYLKSTWSTCSCDLMVPIYCDKIDQIEIFKRVKRTVRSIYLNLYDAFVKKNSYAIHQIARDFVLVSRSSLSAHKNVRILF